ncbi:hypothetical protein ACH5RR_023413 [Cinchona calisaya]|uniref:Uncharacterized protein n=1 Tax=Cinchona calisaya TaxID=153742 RepID=A0ABD2ZAL4_9GENT
MKAAELKTRVQKKGEAPRGLEGTGKDGWIIELEANRREQLFPFHWFLKAINPYISHIKSLSRIDSASNDEPM